MTENLSSSAMPGVDSDDFAFQHHASSPHSLKQLELDPFSSPPAPPLENHSYNFSSTVYDESSASNTDHEHEYVTEDEDGALLRAVGDGASSRSSISSFPGSIVPLDTYGIDQLAQDPSYAQNTPTKSPKVLHHHRSGSLGYKIKSPAQNNVGSNNSKVRELSTREYNPAFRNPSSVVAMQMRDEEPFVDDRDDRGSRSLSGHRRRGSRMSIYSHRSSNSTQTSPTKRKSSPLKTVVKTEFPLVLLHCTLLPPTLGALTLPLSFSGHLSPSDEEALLKEVLPEVYWRRWKLLKEKIEKNIELRTRGVLVSHPRAEYELLEERLLESLELERERIREGHYLQRDAEDESAPDDSHHEEEDLNADAEERGSKTKCTDCGNKVSTGVEVERKWEVKVYAANGLMRAGAWSAAWSEMEKVDVEVGVWMPESVRREVEDKLAAMGFGGHDDQMGAEHEEEVIEDEEERRRREVYGTGQSDEQEQEKIDGLFENHHHAQRDLHGDDMQSASHQQYPAENASLQDLAVNYIKVMAQDRRNVLIMFLSILVLFYAVNIPAGMREEQPASLAVVSAGPETAQVEFVTMTVTSTSVSTSTALSVSTTTILESLPTALEALPDTVMTDEQAAEAEPTQSATEEVRSSLPEAAESIEPSSVEVNEEEEEEEEEEEAHHPPSVAEIMVDMLVGDDHVLVDG